MSAVAALCVYLAEPAAQVNDAHLSPVPSLSVVAAVAAVAAHAESFPFKPVAQVDKLALSFAPSAGSVDLATEKLLLQLHQRSLSHGYLLSLLLLLHYSFILLNRLFK